MNTVSKNVSSGYSVCAFVGTGTGGPLIVGRKHDSSQISLGRRIIRSRFASCHFHLYRKAINPSFEKFYLMVEDPAPLRFSPDSILEIAIEIYRLL